MKTIHVVSDYRAGGRKLRDDVQACFPDNVTVDLLFRNPARKLLETPKDPGTDESFVFVLPKGSRTIVYTMKDVVDSFYNELNLAIERCGGNVASRDIRNVFIIIYDFKKDVSEKEFYHKDIEAIWMGQVQPELAIFKEVLFTLEGFSLNSRQKKYLKNTLDSSVSATGGGCISTFRQYWAPLTLWLRYHLPCRESPDDVDGYQYNELRPFLDENT
eukprot:m.40521 g.40521  ORF g.40521 m.40521 type:complete len:216 (+) comp32975_c0_seq2:32-679(+)